MWYVGLKLYAAPSGRINPAATTSHRRPLDDQAELDIEVGRTAIFRESRFNSELQFLLPSNRSSERYASNGGGVPVITLALVQISQSFSRIFAFVGLVTTFAVRRRCQHNGKTSETCRALIEIESSLKLEVLD